MKVSELIAQLLELDQDALVVMSSDQEGNSYHPVTVLDSILYSNYEQAVFDDEEELIKYVFEDDDYDDEELAEMKEQYNPVPAIAIWP